MRVRSHPSANFGPRRGDASPELVVLHHTGMASAEAALARLSDPGAEVSAHYLITAAGEIVQLVDETARAWHAGAGGWGEWGDVNSASIGIELDNCGNRPFGEAQMAALEWLLADVLERHALPPERVIAHADMAPGRKADPGDRFDWRRLALSGLAVWPEPEPEPGPEPEPEPEPGAFLRLAADFGYRATAGPAAVLAAFRLRFRPGVTGPLDSRDMALAADLARRYPVDRGAHST